MQRIDRFLYLGALVGLFSNPSSAATIYGQTNLTSDIPGLAANTDASLKNPWGVSFGPTSPFWVSDQVTGIATLYNAAGQRQTLFVATPPAAPTGQVFNSTSASFLEANGQKATFIFATIPGTIDAWNIGNGGSAVVEATSANSAYTGLALANNGSGDFLYAANFRSGNIDVFNSSFTPVSPSAPFTDPNLPAGYAPYGIQNIGGKLYVQYAQVDPVTHKAAVGPGLGIVDVFDPNGGAPHRLVTGGVLNAPWGITLAPSAFGDFSNDLLIGNFGDGVIDAFDPMSGDFRGSLKDANGNPIANPGLWALEFRAAPNFDPSTLFFTAGINNEADGLFGSIQVTPEPGTLVPMALGLALAGLLRRHVLLKPGHRALH